ncbi:MAG: PIN domain-containing protein [Verrucomicrobia bacterium]|nr:PIN domain-containing protein [Verrucomicrobiota bacterium]
MAERVVFDTSAFLTLTGDEPGAEQVQSHVTDAIAERIQLHASFVSLVEYITLQEEGAEVAPQRLAEVRTLPVQWPHSDDALCSAAAKLKAAHRISFADSFAAALAQRLDATLVHKDPEFDALHGIVKLAGLPSKNE